MQRKISGGQSWLPPDFQPAFDAYEGSRMTRKSRLKGGCRQDCLPHMAASSMTRTIAGAKSRGGVEGECPHEWGHGSLEGYATGARRGSSAGYSPDSLSANPE
jgi:hypothetical protein